MSESGVFSGPYFPVFSPNAGKYRSENTPYLDAFHAVLTCMVIRKEENVSSDFAIYVNSKYSSLSMNIWSQCTWCGTTFKFTDIL